MLVHLKIIWQFHAHPYDRIDNVALRSHAFKFSGAGFILSNVPLCLEKKLVTPTGTCVYQLSF
jgi:hypothetical protein